MVFYAIFWVKKAPKSGLWDDQGRLNFLKKSHTFFKGVSSKRRARFHTNWPQKTGHILKKKCVFLTQKIDFFTWKKWKNVFFSSKKWFFTLKKVKILTLFLVIFGLFFDPIFGPHFKQNHRLFPRFENTKMVKKWVKKL